jgi:hypothetical protein
MVVVSLATFVVVLAMFALVAVAAIRRARPEDIPLLLKECGHVFRWLAERMSVLQGSLDQVPRSGEGPGEEPRKEGM